MNIKFKKTHKDAQIPTKGSSGAAGYDLYSVDDMALIPGCINKINTGIALQIPHNHVGLIWDRSGLSSKGLKVHGGVIDSDFIGTVLVMLNNTTKDVLAVKKGDRIAQLLIQPVLNHDHVNWELVGELEQTERGNQGWGSTGV